MIIILRIRFTKIFFGKSAKKKCFSDQTLRWSGWPTKLPQGVHDKRRSVPGVDPWKSSEEYHKNGLIPSHSRFRTSPAIHQHFILAQKSKQLCGTIKSRCYWANYNNYGFCQTGQLTPAVNCLQLGYTESIFGDTFNLPSTSRKPFKQEFYPYWKRILECDLSIWVAVKNVQNCQVKTRWCLLRKKF